MLMFISKLELRMGLFLARSHRVGQGTEQQEEEGWVNPSEPQWLGSFFLSLHIIQTECEHYVYGGARVGFQLRSCLPWLMLGGNGPTAALGADSRQRPPPPHWHTWFPRPHPR